MLAGKRLLVTGVVTREAIAFAVARAGPARRRRGGAHRLRRGRRRITERAAARLPEPPDVLELDVNSEDRPRRADG